MSSKNTTSKILLGLAILGFILIWPFFAGSNRFRNSINGKDGTLLYPLLIGTLFILPYFVHLFFSKPNRRKKLKGNLSSRLHKPQKNVFEVFVLNESEETLIINRKFELDHNQWHIFTLKKNDSLYFSNGVVFDIDKNSDLEVQDFRNQVLGLGDEYFKKYNLPDHINWAFVIAKLNEGDPVEES